MKYLAAYCLFVLGHHKSPSAAEVNAILKAAGIDAQEDQAKKVVDALNGKDLSKLIAEGLTKVSSLSFGGGSGAPAATTQAAAPADAKKEPAKIVEKEKPKEEEPEDGLDGGLDLFGF